MIKIINREFITYCLVGLINTFVGITTAFVSLNILLFNYAVSTGLAYLTGIIVSFLLNKKYTFKNKGKGSIQFVKFFSTMLPAYIFSYWSGFQTVHFCSKFGKNILDFLSTLTNIPQSRILDNLSVILSMGIYLIVGFYINKFIVFTNKNNLNINEKLSKTTENTKENIS